MDMPNTSLKRCLAACEKERFAFAAVGRGGEAEGQGELLLTLTINEKFSGQEEQGGGSCSLLKVKLVQMCPISFQRGPDLIDLLQQTSSDL